MPAGVPGGAPLPIVTEADWPGPSVTNEDERLVAHPEGSLDAKLIGLDAQPELSLLLTVAE